MNAITAALKRLWAAPLAYCRARWREWNEDWGSNEW